MIARKLTHRVPTHIQVKGQAIYSSQRSIDVQSATDVAFAAIVDGTEPYEVDLDFEDDALLVHCTCPYYRDRGVCKHIWACILEADRRGALSKAEKARWLELDDTPFEEEEDFELTNPAYPARSPMKSVPQTPEWEERLLAVRRAQTMEATSAPAWHGDSEIQYELDHLQSSRSDSIVVQMFYRTRKKNGDWSVSKELRLNSRQIHLLPDPADAEIATLLFGASEQTYYPDYVPSSFYQNQSFRAMTGPMALRVLPLMAATGRLSFRRDSRRFPLSWDDGPAWEFILDIHRDASDLWWLSGQLRRDGKSRGAFQTELILESGLFIADGCISRFRNEGARAWVKQLAMSQGIRFRDSERDKVLEAILQAGPLPVVQAEAEMSLTKVMGTPAFGLRISSPRGATRDEALHAALLLKYTQQEQWHPYSETRAIWFPENRLLVERDHPAEMAALELLRQLGARVAVTPPHEARVPSRALPKLVRELMAREWHVEAEGRTFRKPGEARLDVRSGIDWFELHAGVQFEDTSVGLPELLAAVRRGESIVRLGDGSFGLLPEEWLEKVAPLVSLGEEHEGHLRFRRNQTMVLDALLAAQPAVEYDRAFADAREKLKSFHGILPAEQPAGFQGTLRDYQKLGLGWMSFLQDLGFGGCLADDMGVGKTAQVLALLESQRVRKAGPSLVVAPKSLMFNWREEAARFTPNLKVLLHLGGERDTQLISNANLVLTTYGTLLRDAVQLAEVPFDYVVLDEAQAVKNAATASSKAVRLLKANHRLALSGTPVENHLGELWSLFEFLNPGMLGESKVLKLAGGLGQNPSEEARQLLSHALRPFILRRTKRQVARELPEKTEQTIFCELESAQRKLYDELKNHYREKLLGRDAVKGWSRNKFQVLEALLRLRQAACHPGLIDEKKKSAPSAKLELLLDQLAEIREEGHKALVFSQFTSLLGILRSRLDAGQIKYQYLDGKTRDRESCVQQFQQDPDCPLFLISLKAGGLGLNLTAAEYVFLLDPWWNPAVESQAIDRAHRIGQTRNVFAYRLIAKDTVEEKVLELQKSKRDLADAILSEDNAILRDLKPEDLAMLLS